MNILLTNDDGIFAEGIEIAEKILSKHHNVYVVAPKEHMSAKSVSITILKNVEFKKLAENKYYVDGTPADCVSFALSYLKDIKFDLVVSGVNNGFNISYDTLYSGTIGACVQATINKVPSIALSCSGDFKIVKENLETVFEQIINDYFPINGYIINVNFPKGDVIEGIKLSRLYNRKDEHWIIVNEDDTFKFNRKMEEEFSDKDSDCYLINNHFVSVTPLNASYFHISGYEFYKNRK